MRLDKFLLEKYDLKSRTYAENLILTGKVSVGGRVVVKPAYDVDESDEISVDMGEGYASQGAYKLEEAFRTFRLSVSNKYCVDLGCSNGGFTDVLLRHGAAKILAIDVGECALEKRILDDPRVEFLRANARDLPSDIKKADFVCSDLSFISLKLVLKGIYDLLKVGGEAVVLVKPQFELTKQALSKRGIVTSGKLREQALLGVKVFAEEIGFVAVGQTTSPVRYENKNIEYLLYLKK